MGNDIYIPDQGELDIFREHDITELTNHLRQEIHLFDTLVAGTTYLEDKSVLDDLQEGDRLILQREENKYDAKAILVLNREKQKLGYVPEKDNLIFARLMDAGKLLIGKVKKHELDGPYHRIRIGIYMVEY